MESKTVEAKVVPARKKVPTEIVVYKDWCKACGICVEFCPKHVLETGTHGYPLVAHPEACSSCDLCELLCPDFAITLTRAGEKEEAEFFTTETQSHGDGN